ncbi:unnamed protein product [Musa acuminata subsp. malaccensis]|uniref:(wild Malaysian banana) hypothetical protein n=1 Tax=Musa acuminata subsp. malaccensis TaxID=214687 RepID=A0A8D6ZT89_MUSAM|nr:unnamed protein product [Musa acuminata subsp. malaccensis]
MILRVPYARRLWVQRLAQRRPYACRLPPLGWCSWRWRLWRSTSPQLAYLRREGQGEPRATVVAQRCVDHQDLRQVCPFLVCMK